MIQAGWWPAKRTQHPVVHPRRERRARFGELGQIDGSPYAGFAERAPAGVLRVFEEATGRLGELLLTEAETPCRSWEAAEQ